jgi:CHAD domain-containing protein
MRQDIHMSTDHTEIEWQFDAPDLEVVQQWLAKCAQGQEITVQPDKTCQQQDTYCDTADWRISQAGYTLRVRRIGDQAETTLKSVVSAEKGKARHRREINEDLPTPAPTEDALSLLQHAQGDVSRRARALAGAHPLRRLFELHTQRQVYQLRIAGEPAGEIALDETCIIARPRGKEVHLQRVEVEVQDDKNANLAAFVIEMCQACELRPAMVTKFEAGLLAQHLTPPPAPHFGSPAVDRSSTIGELALATLRKYFAAALVHEPGVRLDEDVEELHNMRLSIARMRAALRLFKHVLPDPLNDLTGDVKWIGALLGAVRDLDVQMGATNEEVVVQLLAEKRRTAHQELMRALDSPRYEKLKGQMSTLLSHPQKGPRSADDPAVAVVPGVIRRAHYKALKLGDVLGPGSSPEEYHALRIRLKRLRYSLEFVKKLYGKPAKCMLERVNRLADVLGEYHDLHVMDEQCRAWRADPAMAHAIGALDALSQRCAIRAGELRGAFPAFYAPLSGKCWKRLLKTM